MVRRKVLAGGKCHKALAECADVMFRNPAKTVHGIDVVVGEIAVDRLAPAQGLESLPEDCVLHVLEGPDGCRGLSVMQAVLVDGVIEQQTLGRVSSAPRIPRAITRIDTALSEPFIASALAHLDELASTRPDGAGLCGFRIKGAEMDLAALSLILDDAAYDRLRVTLDFGPGLKSGQIHLWFPARDDQGEQPTQARRTGPPPPHLTTVLGKAPVRLSVSLGTIPVTLKQIINLSEDTILPLPADSFSAAELCDRNGMPIARGRLGQLAGHRAIRVEKLADDAEEDVFNMFEEPAQLTTSSPMAPHQTTPPAGEAAPPSASSSSSAQVDQGALLQPEGVGS